MDNDFIFQVIEKLMADGKSDPKIRGWAMSDIVTKIGDRFGEDKKSVARAYIMSKCGVTDDEQFHKNIWQFRLSTKGLC